MTLGDQPFAVGCHCNDAFYGPHCEYLRYDVEEVFKPKDSSTTESGRDEDQRFSDPIVGVLGMIGGVSFGCLLFFVGISVKRRRHLERRRLEILQTLTARHHADSFVGVPWNSNSEAHIEEGAIASKSKVIYPYLQDEDTAGDEEVVEFGVGVMGRRCGPAVADVVKVGAIDFGSDGNDNPTSLGSERGGTAVNNGDFFFS
jgi:hypothetical protein